MNWFATTIALGIFHLAQGSSEIQPTYQQYVLSQLPANHIVVNLNFVIETLSLKQPLEKHQLTSFLFINSTSDSQRNVGNDPTFMLCSFKPRNGASGYFCLDKNTWDLKTTKSYHPPINSSESIILDFQASGLFYRVELLIREKCKAQEMVYRNLKRTCLPFTSIVNFRHIKSEIDKIRLEYFLPRTAQPNELVLDTLKFTNLVSYTFDFEIFQGDASLRGGMTKITSSTQHVALELPLNGMLSTLYVTLNTTSLPVDSEITINYYSQKEFCQNKVCLMNYYYWEDIVGYLTVAEKTRCVSDPSRIKRSYDSCYRHFSITINSSATQYRFGDNAQLLCMFETFLPHSVTWYRIRNEKTTKVASDVRFNISSLSFEDNSFLVCSVTTVSNKYTVASQRFKLRLTDVFTGELQIHLRNIVFTDAHKDHNSLVYRNLITRLEKEVEMTLKSKTSVTRLEYSSVFLQEVDNTVLVIGELNVVKDNALLRMSYLDWTSFVVRILKQERLPVSTNDFDVTFFTEDTCSNSTTFRGERKGYSFQWPAIEAGTTVSLPCPNGDSTFTTRRCVKHLYKNAEWEEQQDRFCVYPDLQTTIMSTTTTTTESKTTTTTSVTITAPSPTTTSPSPTTTSASTTTTSASTTTIKRRPENVTESLEILTQTQITEKNAVVASERLEKASENMTSTYEVTMLTSVLQKFEDFMTNNLTTNVVNNTMAAVDNLMKMPQSVLAESQSVNRSSSKVLQFLGNTGDKLARTEPFVIKQKHFTLGTVQLNPSKFKGLRADVINADSFRDIDFHMNNRLIVSQHKDAYGEIVLPDDILRDVSKSLTSLNVVVISYDTDKLFVVNEQKNDSYAGENWKVNTQVVSAELRGQIIKNLEKPVILKFKAKNESFAENDKACVYWDATENIWTDKGCYLYEFNKITGEYTCHCNHLTNFAILFNAQPPKGVHGEILTILTYVGSALSLAGALFTFLTYAIFPMLRESIPPKILMNLCISLILLTSLFLYGVKRRTSEVGCRVIAIFLQYLFLCVFSWSAVEGFHSARGLVYPMKPEINLFIQKGFVFGWGVPLIFTTVGAGIWYSDYGDDQSCIVQSKPFYVTVLPPVAMALLFNMMALIMISKEIRSRNIEFRQNQLKLRSRLRIITGFVIMYCLTWSLGVLTLVSNKVVLQYPFCVFSSLQGFYLFSFYCVNNPRIQRFWLEILLGHTVRQTQRNFTLQSQRVPTSPHDAQNVKKNETTRFFT